MSAFRAQMRKSRMLLSAKLRSVTWLATSASEGVQWTATNLQKGPQVLLRTYWSDWNEEPSVGGLHLPPSAIYSTGSGCQHELPFPADTPYCACLRTDMSLLLVAPDSSMHGMQCSQGGPCRLNCYIMNLHSGVCERQAGMSSFWPAWSLQDDYQPSMCHSQARRILSFANPSTVIVTNADNLKEVTRFDVSPAKVQFDQFGAVVWSDDGSMVVVRATRNLTLLAKEVTCSIHVYDAARGECLGCVLLPAQCPRSDYYLSIYWSPEKDLLAAGVTSKAASAGDNEAEPFYDMLLFNVITGANAWASSTLGRPCMRQCGQCHHLRSCSPDGQLALVGADEYHKASGFVMVVDTRQLQHIWSHMYSQVDDDSQDWKYECGTWTVDGSVTILSMPHYGHQLRIRQQGESFIVVEQSMPSLEQPHEPGIPGRYTDRLTDDAYIYEGKWYFPCYSPAPLPQSLPQVSARFAYPFGKTGIDQTSPRSKLELICADSGRLLGSWTMKTLLKQAQFKKKTSWWLMPFQHDDLSIGSADWSPDASHLLLRFSSFLLVVAFDA